MDLKEKILSAFKEAGEPIKVGQIVEMIGEDKKEVDKIIKKLKAEEMIHSPKRCYYEIK